MHIERDTALSTPLFVERDAIQTQQSTARRFCRVPVVDDDGLVRARLAALPQAAEYQVEVAASGEKALRVLNTTQCQIALTDWQMADLDGWCSVAREFEHCMRGDRAMAILTCNINGFGPDNEPFGADPSKDVLRSFVMGVKSLVRKADCIARTGPNIFMIVLLKTTSQGAQCVAKRLTRFFSLHPVSTSAGSSSIVANIEVTAVAAQHGVNSALQINALLRIADRMSYIINYMEGITLRGTGSTADAETF